MVKHSWKRMSSGKYLDINNLKESDIDIRDINTSLNMTKRFNGHYKDEEPLTVAQHTLLCCNIADMLFPDEPLVKRAVVIHDFAEYIYGDIATPIKKLMGPLFIRFAKPIDKLVSKRFWVNGIETEPSESVHSCVKVCDLLSMDIERRAMWKDQRGKDKWPETTDTKLSLLDKQAMFDEVKGQYVDLEELYMSVFEKGFKEC